MADFIKNKIHNLVSDARFSEILKGSTWALAARVAAAGLGLISSIIIARYYGADIMGIVALIESFLLLATIFTVLGTNTSILRLIPEHMVKYSPTSAFNVYRKTQFLVIGMSFATGALFFLGADIIAEKVFSKPHLSFYLALASLFVVFKSLMLFNTQAVRGLRLIKGFALMLILPQGFNLLLLILLGLLSGSQYVPVYAMLFGFAMTGILGWAIMELSFRRKIQPSDRIQSMTRTTILSISLPMFMTAAMNLVMGQIGVIMLGMFRSSTEVGFYAIAVKLGTLTAFILQAVNSMAGPKFSELFHSGKLEELFYVAKKSAKLIFWTTAPILLAFIVLGKPVLRIAFGSEFVAAYGALVLLALGQFVNSISGSSGMFMNMTGNQKVFRNIILISAILNVALNYVLIPIAGIEGAAIAATASVCTWNVSTLVYIKANYGKTTGYFPRPAWL